MFKVLLVLFLQICNYSIGKANDKLAVYNSIYESDYLTPIYDVYFSHNKAFLIDHHYLPDLILFINMLLSCWFIEDYNLLLNSLIAFYLIRGICIFITVGYVSVRFLEKKKINQKGTNTIFTDLCISGHVGMCCILSLCVVNPVIRFLSLILSGLMIFVNLAVGDHYSSDVFLGTVLAVLITTSTLVNYV